MSIDLAIGQEFGNYRLTSLLGRGGFAEVYLGEHVYLKTQAAIKVLQTLLEQEEQERFYEEARTVAHLQHEHIVRVLEFGLNDGSVPYLVMEYAPNGTLRERFPRGIAVPIEQILPPLKQVVAALNYAHNENLVHRDIKPENMLLGTHDEVLLSDFGIALMISGSRRQGPQDVAGTITYMAPEQLLGHPTKASDQYALGVVVYEWLTGERLFSGSFIEIATQHMLKSPPSLQSHGIPVAVEQVVFKALAKKPEQRFATVQDFADALEAAAHGQTYKVEPADLPSPSPANTGSALVDGISSSTTRKFQPDPPFTPLPPGRQRSSSRILKIGLLALVLLLIIGGGLAYALLETRPANTPQQMQALYTSVTSREPQINDPLSAESTLIWAASSKGDCIFKGGAFHALHPTAASCSTTNIALRDLAYQAEVTIVQGTNGGLIFHNNFLPNPNGGLYYFIVTTKGDFSLFDRSITYQNKQFSASGPRLLIGPQRSSAIKTGLGQTNLLTVITRGTSIYLYINKRFVGSAQDSTSLSGTIGMFGGGEASGSAVDVVFKNAQVWALQQ